MREIVVPRINTNEDSCILVEWSVVDGARVETDAAVAVVETSKATAEVYGEIGGVVQSAAAAGTECQVGEVIGWIFEDDAERERFLSSRADHAAGGPDGGPLLTDDARALATLHGVGEERLRALGKRLIRAADVRKLVELGSALPARAARTPLPSRQRTVADVVSRAHRTIPDAFVSMRIDCGPLLDRLSAATGADATPPGLPEAMVTILASLRLSHPVFFASVTEDERVVMPGEGAHVGVTIDVGTGLFVPVVVDAGTMTVDEVADRLMEFRVKALREDFRAADLEGGQLTLSLHMDPDITAAVPIIQPPQVCVVSLTAERLELWRDERGEIRDRRCVTVGLSYDHRVVNGREAVDFLGAVRAIVQRPAEVAR